MVERTQEKRAEYLEQRRYIRLEAAFPVEFQLLDPETKGSISDIAQGFTRDIGKGGLCLEINSTDKNFEEVLREEKAVLKLCIHIPLSHRETRATASIAWHKKIKSGYPNKYIVGLSFIEIDPKDKNRIYFHARRIVLTPKIVSVLILFLIAGLSYFYASDFKLREENKRLVKQLVQLSNKKSQLEQNIIEFDSERSNIEKALLENQRKVELYKDKVEELKSVSAELKRKDELLAAFQQDRAATKRRLKEALSERINLSKKALGLLKESEYLRNRVAKLSADRVTAEDSLRELLKSFELVEEKGISSMYKWLKNHQKINTGLVVSYEGDREIEDWAFTYDQSLAIQCFTLVGDQRNAQQTLDFYRDRAEKVDGGFVNGYDAITGSIVEYAVHAGPNIWLGIAILQYAHRFKDEQYLLMAEDIGEWLIELQNQDEGSGIRGGPKFSWFSTEHNLDAYAFFGMLYEATGEKKYLEAWQKVFEWIKKNTFNRREGRFNRGKGDATIATDTFAWAIAAIGPGLLKQSDMDPDQIMDFAETNCLVTTYYNRPEGENIKITGFDFGKYTNIARGGIISTEWTAQMVVALNIMAGYHRENNDFLKAGYYKRKADFYLSELEKMVIISSSKIGQGEGCLPYASHDNIDTGHGWRAPNGSKTGSTAGTAYTIFASYNYNPLRIE